LKVADDRGAMGTATTLLVIFWMKFNFLR
jgi:hypothetical protein